MIAADLLNIRNASDQMTGISTTVRLATTAMSQANVAQKSSSRFPLH